MSVDMEQWPLWLNAFVFCGAATVIWFAGTRLERLADAISLRTGLGQAFTGMLLLAAAPSLPEVAMTITAIAVLGNPTLAAHNLLGGVAFQTTILAAADAVGMSRLAGVVPSLHAVRGDERACMASFVWAASRAAAKGPDERSAPQQGTCRRSAAR